MSPPIKQIYYLGLNRLKNNKVRIFTWLVLETIFNTPESKWLWGRVYEEQCLERKGVLPEINLVVY